MLPCQRRKTHLGEGGGDPAIHASSSLIGTFDSTRNPNLHVRFQFREHPVDSWSIPLEYILLMGIVKVDYIYLCISTPTKLPGIGHAPDSGIALNSQDAAIPD